MILIPMIPMRNYCLKKGNTMLLSKITRKHYLIIQDLFHQKSVLPPLICIKETMRKPEKNYSSFSIRQEMTAKKELPCLIWLLLMPMKENLIWHLPKWKKNMQSLKKRMIMVICQAILPLLGLSFMKAENIRKPLINLNNPLMYFQNLHLLRL